MIHEETQQSPYNDWHFEQRNRDSLTGISLRGFKDCDSVVGQEVRDDKLPFLVDGIVGSHVRHKTQNVTFQSMPDNKREYNQRNAIKYTPRFKLGKVLL